MIQTKQNAILNIESGHSFVSPTYNNIGRWNCSKSKWPNTLENDEIFKDGFITLFRLYSIGCKKDNWWNVLWKSTLPNWSGVWVFGCKTTNILSWLVIERQPVATFTTSMNVVRELYLELKSDLLPSLAHGLIDVDLASGVARDCCLAVNACGPAARFLSQCLCHGFVLNRHMFHRVVVTRLELVLT